MVKHGLSVFTFYTIYKFFTERSTYMPDEQNELAKVEIKQTTGVAGFMSRITDDDTILGSVCKNVILPRLVDTAYEGAVAALKKFFWGEDTKWSRGGGQSSRSNSIIIGSNHTAYNQMSNRSGPEPSRTESPLSNAITGAGRRKANAYSIRIKDDPSNGIDAWEKGRTIEDALVEKFKISGLISVQDLYMAAGVPDIPSTALDWGWDSIAELRRFRDLDDDRYVVVQLPKPKDITKL